MKHLANLVTISRAPLGIAIALLLQNPTYSNLILCIVLAVLAEATDFIDGTIARATNSVSAIGKALDPLCIGFTMAGWMVLPLLFVFVFRDIIVAYSRIFAAQAQKDVAARVSGKIKAVFQGVAQIGVLAYAVFTYDKMDIGTNILTQGLLISAAAVTFISMIDYTYHNVK
jgi:CDP-diacylglycerol--glycerol-3-phosphate 3-phosphatidyltransferase